MGITVRQLVEEETDDIIQAGPDHVVVIRRFDEPFANPLFDDDEGRLIDFVVGDYTNISKESAARANFIAEAQERGAPEGCDLGEAIRWARNEGKGSGILIAPVHKFEHGLVGFSTAAKGDPWDECLAGFAWSTRERYENAQVSPDRFMGEAKTLLENYSDFCNGDVWEVYVVSGKVTDGVMDFDPRDAGADDFECSEICYGRLEAEKCAEAMAAPFSPKAGQRPKM